MMRSFVPLLLCFLSYLSSVTVAFAPSRAATRKVAFRTSDNKYHVATTSRRPTAPLTALFVFGGGGGGKKSEPPKVGKQISDKRRKQLGIVQGEDEYDLDFALDANTDPLITKIIAGSFILIMIALLVAGVVLPSLTDYGEGVCSPIQNGGRC